MTLKILTGSPMVITHAQPAKLTVDLHGRRYKSW